MLRLVTGAVALLLAAVTATAAYVDPGRASQSALATTKVASSDASVQTPLEFAGFAPQTAPAPTSPATPTSASNLAPPNAMAALGDSITRGFNACGFYFDCVQRSWSTGTDIGVDSHYLGVLSQNPVISGKNYNDAKTGAVSADMVGQAQQAVAQHVDYVTLLVGANDACRPTESQMTSVDTYRQQVQAALSVIKSGLPGARIFIASIPNVKRVWETSHNNIGAQLAWKLGHICQSLLANPTSSAAADNQRRDRVQQRVVDYNAVLRQLCANYGSDCKFDDDAVYNFDFGAKLLSNFDFFHPNGNGQQALAEVTKEAGFRWQSAAQQVSS